MKILKIAIKNLNSLRTETTLDFTAAPLADAGLFAIVGDTGAGKTTLLDALTLGLYGRIHRNKEEKEVLSYGTAEGYAEVEFAIQKDIYRGKWMIWRSRHKLEGNLNVKRELSKWNPETHNFEVLTVKIRDINEQIEAITGLDYERFCKSVLLSQGDFAAFLKAGDKDRSNVLERITGTAVYSEISIAAFKKFKIEEQKAENTKKQLEALNILDSETVSRLQAELKDLGKESGSLQKQLESIQEAIQWRRRIGELEEQKAGLLAQLQILEKRREAAQPSFLRLAEHQRTLAFQKQLNQLDHLEASRLELAEEVQKTLEQKDLLNQKKERIQTKVEQISAELKQLKKEQEEKEILFRKVDMLDVQIQEKREPLQLLLKEQHKLEDTEKETAQKLSQSRQKAEAGKDRIRKISEWQKKNEVFKNLGGLIPVLKSLSEEWLVLKARQETEENEQVAIVRSLNKINLSIGRIDQQLVREQNALSQLENQFKVPVGGNEPGELGAYVESINHKTDLLETRKKNLELLIDLNQDYTSLIQDLGKCEEEAEVLQNSLGIIELELLSIIEKEESIEKDFRFKTEMYEREKLFANYERERHNLREGEECPLCLSVNHPFRKLKNRTPYVDQAKKEKEKAENRLNIIRQEIKEQTNQQNALHLRMRQINGNGEQDDEGKRSMILKRLHQTEMKMSRLALEMEDTSLFHQTDVTILNKQFQQISKQITENRRLRDTFSGYSQQWQLLVKKIASLKEELGREKIEKATLETKLETMDSDLANRKERSKKVSVEIERLLNPLNLSFEEQDPGELLLFLQKKQTEMEKAILRLQQEEKELALLQQEIAGLTGQQRELSENCKTHLAKINKAKEELDQLSGKRKTLFGDQGVDAVRQIQKQKVAETGIKADKLNDQQKQAELTFTSESAKNKKAEKDLQKVVVQLEKVMAELTGRLKLHGFIDLAGLRVAHLPESVAREFQELQASIEKQSTQQKQSYSDIIHELEKTLEKALTTESRDTLREKFNSQNEIFQNLQQQMGKIIQRIEDNESREKEGTALRKKMDRQLADFQRWRKLKDLIGSADGKVFRAFAQGLTLKRLTELANRHLQQLHGRYLLYKPGDKDLELQIIDTHQANNVRSIHTLSGGESFLASLALALGLSDLAGQNTNIQSLFIDEGFGTLDESALDLAISTLENLQSRGKSIGVISHVPALKERIATQIQVSKRGSGFSEIAVV